MPSSDTEEHASQDLLSIGEFSRLSGLSIGALRHYDAEGVLRPSVVDPATSYRRYRRIQLAAARTIAKLRSLELPLEDIRQTLGTNDQGVRRQILTAHNARVQARVTRLHWILHQLSHEDGTNLTDTHSELEETVMPDPTVAEPLDAATQKELAKRLFNRVWELLEQPDRSLADDEELVDAAHASRYFWSLVGDTQNLAISDWQLSRVFAVLGAFGTRRPPRSTLPAARWNVARGHLVAGLGLRSAGQGLRGVRRPSGRQ